jgi:nicotinate (nicotinamide) nucleotide adenylyltransferase
MAKIGILGGSFNPIHAGHMRMAIDAREALGLERVLLVPVGEAPHKPKAEMLPFAHRLRLVELAVRGVNGLSASGLEGNRPGPSYTVDTLLALREKMVDDELWFLMGSESFRALPKWNRGLELPGLCNMGVIVRAGDTPDTLFAHAQEFWPGTERVDDKYLRLPGGTMLSFVIMPVLDVNSTDIRRRWREKRCLSMLVPQAAEEIVERGGSAYEQAWGRREEV